MAPITNVTIGTSATAIDTTGSIPPVLFNASDEDMTLQFGGDGDTLELKVGQARGVMAGMQVTALCASGGKKLQVLRGVTLVNGAPSDDAPLGQTVVDATDLTDDTHEYYIDTGNFLYGVLHILIGCDAGTVTVTVEAAVQSEGQADVDSAFIDATQEIAGVASLVATAGTAEALWAISAPFPVRYLKVKIVTATTAATGDATVYYRGR